MAAIKGLNIPITATYDGRGVSQATTSLGALEGVAKKLVGALSITALAEFGKKAVAMANAQNLAFTELDNTLKNIGLGYGVSQVTELINKFSEATGVAKEKLIPAFQTLSVATGSLSESQSTLQTALDVSAGTGNDLVTVSDALAKAYLGNYKALGQLNAGMTAASLKGKNMQQILAQLNQTYGGAASAAAQTFAGKMQIIKNSVDEATVSIGTGLINSINNLAGNTGVDNLSGQIKGLGDSIRYTLEGYTQALKDIANFPVISLIGKGLNLLSLGLREDIQAYKDLGKSSEQKFSPLTGARAVQTAIDTGKAERLAKEQALQRAKAQAQITASQQKSLELQKAQAVIKGASAVTDLQNIELQAALAQSSDYNINQRLQLQEDLLNGNATAAGALAQQILATNAAALQSLQIDPYGNWVSGATDALNQIKALQAALAANGASTFAITPALQASTASALDAANLDAANALSGADAINADIQSSIDALNSVINQNNALQGSINLNVSATPGLVINATQAATANGTALNINRLTYNFNN
jgi:hypothetical protein